LTAQNKLNRRLDNLYASALTTEATHKGKNTNFHLLSRLLSSFSSLVQKRIRKPKFQLNPDKQRLTAFFSSVNSSYQKVFQKT
jgi:hypothetical protein